MSEDGKDLVSELEGEVIALSSRRSGSSWGAGLYTAVHKTVRIECPAM